MSRRDRPRFAAALSAFFVAAAVALAAGNAAAQEPQPEASPFPAEGQPQATPPPAAGQPEATPPPAAGQPGEAPPPAGEPAPVILPAPPPGPTRAVETQLRVGLGGEFFISLFSNDVVGNGPAFMFSAHWARWWGGFMLGGGPSIHYSFMIENRDPPDKVHQLTLNGELLIGGGIYERFAIYAHILLGFGMISAYDAATDDTLVMFWGRAVGGVGGYAHVHRMISIGALVDVGFPGTIEALVTVGFHFGSRR